MRACCALAFLGLILVGCSEDRKSASANKRKDGTKDVVKDGLKDRAEPREQVDGVKEKDDARVDPKPRARKVVYTGRIDLIVDDFDEAQGKLSGVIEEHKAYVARSETTGEPGTPRSGTWTLRVPAAGFDAFMDAVAKLGEARKRTKDSDDVTDRYYDTEAEALNLEAREKALRKLYEQKIAGTKLAELMEVDRELARVRGDINVRLGQMKRWDNLASYSTLEVSIRDRKGYVPPESPEFGTQIGRTWTSSIEALVATGKGLVIFAVALTPWLGVLLGVGFLIGVPLRRALKKRRERIEGSGDTPPQ